MKKILTIFAFALLISSQGFAQVMQANTDTTPKTSIKEDVKKISSALELNEKQTEAFVKAFKNKEEALKSEGNLTSELKNKIEQKFLGSLKGILTEDQLSKLKSLKSKK